MTKGGAGPRLSCDSCNVMLGFCKWLCFRFCPCCSYHFPDTTPCICMSHSPLFCGLPVCLRYALPSFWNADPDKFPRKLGLSEWLYRGHAKAPGNLRASQGALKHLLSDRTAKRSSLSPLLFNFMHVLACQERRPCLVRETVPSLKPTPVLLLRESHW